MSDPTFACCSAPHELLAELKETTAGPIILAIEALIIKGIKNAPAILAALEAQFGAALPSWVTWLIQIVLALVPLIP